MVLRCLLARQGSGGGACFGHAWECANVRLASAAGRRDERWAGLLEQGILP